MKALILILALAPASAFACKISFDAKGAARWNCPASSVATIPADHEALEATMKKANPNCLEWCQDNSPYYYCCKNDGSCDLAAVVGH